MAMCEELFFIEGGLSLSSKLHSFIVLYENTRIWFYFPKSIPNNPLLKEAIAELSLHQFYPAYKKQFSEAQIEEICKRSKYGMPKISGDVSSMQFSPILTTRLSQSKNLPTPEDIYLVGKFYSIPNIMERHNACLAAQRQKQPIPNSALYFQVKCINKSVHSNGDRNPSASLNLLLLTIKCFTCKNARNYQRRSVLNFIRTEMNLPKENGSTKKRESTNKNREPAKKRKIAN